MRFQAGRTTWTSPPTEKSGSPDVGRRRSRCSIRPRETIRPSAWVARRTDCSSTLKRRRRPPWRWPASRMDDPVDLAAGWVQESPLIPLLYQCGLMQWEDVSYGWSLFAVYGAVQVAVTFAVCVPLERWRSVERWPDRGAVWVDVLYTVLSRVGVLPLVTFVLFYRTQVALNGWMADHGWVPPTFERLIPSLLG